VELSLASEPAISTQLGNNRILFGPRTQETILTSGAPVPIAASPLAPTRDWESELALIEERYAQFDSDEGAILFIGSSSIRGWRTLQTDFPGLPVLNAGFGGSQIIDAVYFFDRLVRPVAPHTIVMYSGSNDIAAGKSPEQVFADYVAFVDAVHAAFPKTRILYISIAPSPARWSQRFNVQRANRLIELYTNARVFCCPSFYEPVGIINLEAMACETPVVASAVGGIHEVVVDGETGFLVRPGAPEALAKAINTLLANPELARSFGKAGRRRVEAQFSWDSIARQTRDLYAELVASGQAGCE